MLLVILQALLTLQSPPFEKRLSELRDTLLKSDDVDTLALSATLTAGVDLLTALFSGKNEKESVRLRALEVSWLKT